MILEKTHQNNLQSEVQNYKLVRLKHNLSNIFKGTGKLKLKDSGLMELDPNIKNCHTIGGCSLVGDHRGDENIALYSMHTLWVREHNRIAGELKKLNSHWQEEQLFQTARKITTAVYQHIVFQEWLPKVVRSFHYRRYRALVNPGIMNAFATAAFRFGHSLIPNEFEMLNQNFDRVNKPVTLQESFFNREIVTNNGIEKIMFGLVGNKSEEMDTEFAFSIARRLFVKPGSNVYHDLTARNIQRGRDHGLPTYGKYRHWCGLPTINTWEQLAKIMPWKAVESFKSLYKNPYEIDLFAGGIAENQLVWRRRGRVAGSLLVGPTFECIIRRQFKRLQWGDRFYYRAKGMFTRKQRKSIFKTLMSSVLCDNLKNVVSMQKYAFFVPSGRFNKRVVCDSIPKLDLSPWKEEDVDLRRYHKKEAATPNDKMSTNKKITNEILDELDLQDSEMRNSRNDVEETTTQSPTTTSTTAGNPQRKSGLIVEENYNPETEEGEATIGHPDGLFGADEAVNNEEDDLGDMHDIEGNEASTAVATTTTTEGPTVNSLEEYNVEGENIDEEDEQIPVQKKKKKESKDLW